MFRAFLILIGVCCYLTANAQFDIAICPDLTEAPTLQLNKNYSFRDSPAGYGKVSEFPLNPTRSPILFKEERNSAWFKFSVPYDGIISFVITPHKPSDDYDWMLFEETARLSEDIRKETAIPVRTNNARNDERIGGKTGLKEGFDNLYEIPGPRKSFSKLVNVKRGDKYALIVDNIYGEGKGFDLEIRLSLDPERTTLLTGTIQDKGTPLAGTITVENKPSGTFISATKADKKGRYSLKVPAQTELSVVAEHPDYLFQTANLSSGKDSLNQDFSLDRIASGNKLVLFNINFLPNKDALLPSAEAELTRLINLLKANPQFNIKIIGHTNNNVFAGTRYLQQLSFNRAVTVKKKLLQNGIQEKRISCAGMGGKYPIADSKDPVEGLKNLRVEVILF